MDIGRTIEQALEADAEAESGDALYAPYATVIADGTLRRGTPRYAGVPARVRSLSRTLSCRSEVLLPGETPNTAGCPFNQTELKSVVPRLYSSPRRAAMAGGLSRLIARR